MQQISISFTGLIENLALRILKTEKYLFSKIHFWHLISGTVIQIIWKYVDDEQTSSYFIPTLNKYMNSSSLHMFGIVPRVT